MQKIDNQKLLRIIDANFNRSKEGLRVCEDICRFILDQKNYTKQYKDIRHALTESISSLNILSVIEARNIQGDVGTGSTTSELSRLELKDIFYANSQRIKESIRVLEEFMKLYKKKEAQKVKELRYKIYALEKKVVTRL